MPARPRQAASAGHVSTRPRAEIAAGRVFSTTPRPASSFPAPPTACLPDGTIESTTQELIRLNGRKGIDQLGEYKTITYVPSYETVTLHEARVHKAKGGIEPVGAGHVRLRDVNTDHQIYDPSKELVISFPGLEVGDVMEVHWTTRGKHPEYQGQFFNRYTFGHDKYPGRPGRMDGPCPQGQATAVLPWSTAKCR